MSSAIRGNNALNIYDYPYQREVENQKKTIKPKQSVKKKPSVNMSSVIAAILLFLCVFAVVMGHAVINEKVAKNNTLKKELMLMTAANEQAAVSMDRAADLKKIEQVATEKLGMSWAGGNQVVSLDLSLKDQAVVTNEQVGVKTKSLNILQVAGNKIKDVLEYLY